MELIADILLVAGALGAGFYCYILARRLSRFNDLENGVGGAVAVLSAQVDDLSKTLQSAQGAAGESSASLQQLTDRAEGSPNGSSCWWPRCMTWRLPRRNRRRTRPLRSSPATTRRIEVAMAKAAKPGAPDGRKRAKGTRGATAPAGGRKRRRARPRRGTLALIAGLLLTSATIRVALHSDKVMALDGPDMPTAGDTVAAAGCDQPPEVEAMLEAFEARETRLTQRETQLRDRMTALSIADEEIEKKLAQLEEAEIRPARDPGAGRQRRGKRPWSADRRLRKHEAETGRRPVRNHGPGVFRWLPGPDAARSRSRGHGGAVV